MKRKVATAVAAAATVLTALVGCSSGGSGTSSASGGGGGAVSRGSCTNKIVKTGVPQVTVWAWYPAFADVVDLFNNSHSDVQICWTNAGQGNDEYTKFSTAIEAGKGAPDVVMLEDEVLASFAIRKALVDLTGFGANDVKANYTDGAWRDVSSGSAVYAIPVDGGPMGMLYRKDIFDKYGVAVPKTWDDFAAAAKKLAAAGFKGKLVDFPTNGRSFIQALFAQKGATPYTFDLQNPTQVSVKLNDDGSKAVLSYWAALAQAKVVATDEAFTPDYNTKLVSGAYAVYLAAAWGPGYLKGLTGADPNAKWQAAPLPQWDPANPVQVNWGGSAFAVTSQAQNKTLSAKVAKEIFGTEAAWKIGIEKGALFPLWKPILDSDYYKNLTYPFFGGQQINKDVFLAAAAGYKGFTFSPFQNYAYDQLTAQMTAVAGGKKSPAQALDDLQSTVVKYAKDQGFTVTEK
jgi:multiple sugar transport system substrate-binding protein